MESHSHIVRKPRQFGIRAPWNSHVERNHPQAQVSSVLLASITFPVGDEPFGKWLLGFCAEVFQLTPQRAEESLFYNVTLKLQIVS